MGRKTNAFIAAATAAAVATTGLALDEAMAAPRDTKPAVSVQAPTDVSAAKRRVKRSYRRGADAAAIATMMGIIGTTAAIAAANRRHRHYYDPYGYHYRPAPYYGYYRPYRPYRAYPYYGGYRYW